MKKSTKATIAGLTTAAIIVSLSNSYINKNLTKAVYSIKYNHAITNLLNLDRGELLLIDIKESIGKNAQFKKLTYEDITEGEEFISAFSPYIQQYGKYFSGSQVVELKELLKNDYEIIDDEIIDEKKQLYNGMLNVLNCGDEKGNGLKKAYVTSVIKEHFGYGSVLEENKLYWLYEKIVDIIPREVSSKYIIQNDIDGLIEELTKAYELPTDKEIQEIVSLFDQANLDETNFKESNEISDKIEKIYKELLKNKLNNKEFAKTLQGRILNEYLNGKDTYINLKHTEEKTTYQITSKKYGLLHFKSSSIKPDTTLSNDMILITYANELLNLEYNSDDKFSNQTITLCSYIVDWDCLVDFNSNSPVSEFWNSLSNYFSTEKELAEFIIALKDENKIAVEEYLNLVKEIMINKEPTIEQLAEIKSLEEYYYENSYRHAYKFELDAEETDLDSDKVIKGSPEEKHFDIILEDFLFAEVDPEPYFKAIKNAYANSSLLINDMDKNIYKTRDFKNNLKEYKEKNNITVYSKPVYPKEIYINNKQYVYYSCPEEYIDCEYVRIRQNITNDKFEEPVKGIITNIYNYNTGLNEDIILVHLGNKIDINTFEPIVFKTTYTKIIKEDQEKTTDKGLIYSK